MTQARAFLEACSAAGWPQVDDHNAPRAAGAGRVPANSVAGVRQSTALAYLAMARERPNLPTIMTAERCAAWLAQE